MRKSSTYARKRARLGAFDLQRHKAVNPAVKAVILAKIEEQITSLRTDAGLQAYIGADAKRVVEKFGRLGCIVLYAAQTHGLEDTPDARIVAGAASATFDVYASPAALETQRGAIISGLQAIDRLMPKLDVISLAYASQELDSLLFATQNMSQSDAKKVAEKMLGTQKTS